MKRVLSIALMLMLTTGFVFTLTSCSHDDDNSLTEQNDGEKEDDARYYVKYEVNSTFGSKILCSQTVTYTTENGTGTNTQSGSKAGFSWEGTYGPFKKNDKVSLSVSASLLNIKARIYVSRDKEPFTIKAEQERKSNVSLSYTIDF